MACDGCATVTTAPELLAPAPRGQRLCPPCLGRRMAHEARRLRRIGLVGGLLGLLLLGPAPAQAFILLNFAVVLPLAVFLTLAAHEAGHALAARLLGFRVYSITLGQGPLRFSRRLAGVDIMFRGLPRGGCTEAGTRAERWLSLRVALFIAAGPLANLVLLALLVPRWSGGLTTGLAPVPLLVATNALSLLLSLLPIWPQSQTDRYRADGPTLIEALRGSASWRHDRLAAGWYLAALDAYCHQPVEQAEALLAEALAACPHDARLRRLDGEMAMARQDWLAAAERFEALLSAAQPGEARWWDALCLARCLAYAQVDLARADQLTAEVTAAMPWEPLALGTRGLVLVAAGRDAEGAELLDQVAACALSSLWVVEFGTWQARALARLGREDEAQGVLARLHALAPSAPAD